MQKQKAYGLNKKTGFWFQGFRRVVASSREQLLHQSKCQTSDSFAFSVKEQIKSPKKVYAIDTGMAGAVGFSFSENLGHLLENQVYLELKRRGHELYYYKTGNGLEVDFAYCTGGKITQLIQVVHALGDNGTRNRELRSLIKALEETGLERGEIITYEEEEELSVDGKIIRLIPAFKYLLNTEPI